MAESPKCKTTIANHGRHFRINFLSVLRRKEIYICRWLGHNNKLERKDWGPYTKEIDEHRSTVTIQFFFIPTRSTIPGFIYNPNATIATPFFLECEEEKDPIHDLLHLIYCRRTITTESIPKR